MKLPGAEPGWGQRAERTLTSDVARVLSSSTKSAPIWTARTPRWILECLRTQAIVPVEGGVFQVNRVETSSETLRASNSHPDGSPVEISVAVYEEAPKEIALQPVQSIVRISNRAEMLFSDNFDQLQSQLAVAAEYLCETVEDSVFNHSDYGLLSNVAPRMHLKADGPPTPDLLDDLLAKAWRRPDLFAMHPEALAEVRKRATAQSIYLREVELFGSVFSTWRGLPIIPTNKLGVVSSGQGYTTSVVVMRLGQARQGVVCLCAKGAEGSSRLPYITVDFMGLTDDAVARYLMTCYVAMAVLSPGALGRADVSL